MVRAIACVCLFAVLSAGVSAKSLEIFLIDVEGGQATLIVTPGGETLLIDAGYGGRGGRDPDRIMAAAREARVDRIDYFLATHFHGDHVGGVPELVTRIPIGTFIDYGRPMGTDRLAIGAFRAYEPVRNYGPHLQPRPGDRLPLTGIQADIVSAAGAVLEKPLRGGGQTNDACAAREDQPNDDTENHRSLGVWLRFGRFSFVDLGDLSNNKLAELVCPRNLLGKASVYLIAHHANLDSNIPAVLAAIHPRVAIMNNGVTKGGAPESFATLRRQPGLDLWQLHESRNQGAQNAGQAFIANVDDGVTAYWLRLAAREDGSFTITNGRTGVAKNYPK